MGTVPLLTRDGEVQRYHYLGYRVPVGANLRYFVESGSRRILALMQWTSSAWKMAPKAGNKRPHNETLASDVCHSGCCGRIVAADPIERRAGIQPQ